MTQLEIPLGDALFTVDLDIQQLRPARKWQDTTHFHGDYEIHILLNGDALLEIGGKDVHLTAGDICLLAPKSSHYPKSGSDALETINFTCNLTRKHHYEGSGKRFSEYAYYSNILRSVNQYMIISDAQLLDIARRLVAEPFSEENEHIYPAMLAVFFNTMVKRIKGNRSEQEMQGIRGETDNENSFRQRKIVEAFFQQRYHEEVGIEDLASELCLSVPHTHRVVKRVFDGGFKKTLIKQRIEHACMLIKQQKYTLTEVAYRCGYTSYNGFLAAFKSYTGKIPKEYEKSVR
jgi:AraC-like DNA-binding protein/mannose-6-phosphate isomerase-like protein (cupin superfamily)